ncbi:MAG: DNA primase, partial [Anaerolineales bacterium]|nr:DNA primase [Anaerolineales bacterium]
MSTIDEIKSRIDIVDLVSEAGVKLRKAGRNYTGFCPFHDNKHTPAFVVWPETGTWRCFGACNEGGDIFKFVMKRENLDFKEALNKLAARAGVEVPAYTKQTPEQKEAYDQLRQLLEEAVVYYRSHLFNNKDVLDYLREKRGLTDSTIEIFGLGYAPPGYDNLLKHFTSKGYSEEDLIDVGLLSVRDDEEHNTQYATRTFDRFRNRIMIPIRDEQGRMAGFGARVVNPDDIPKFLNSPETPIFSKGRLLYGLDRARKPIRMADQAVIVEGYLDVIALHQAGYENVVSPMGTALTEDQLRLLKRFTRRIVLALDPDTAGQNAVLRGLDAARSAMDKEGELGFDARGLLRNESRLQADLRVASMPDDLDPDEIVARDKDEWARLIENAKPIVTHVMETLAAGQNLNDPKVKNQIAAQILPLIEDLPNPLERDTYRQALARMLRVDERALMGAQPQVPGV